MVSHLMRQIKSAAIHRGKVDVRNMLNETKKVKYSRQNNAHNRKYHGKRYPEQDGRIKIGTI